MKTKLLNLYCVAMVLLLVFTGCEKTVEGELSTWERNVNKVNLLAGKYPQFKSHLLNILAEAEKQKEEALKIEIEEEKIKALTLANSQLYSSFVRDVAEFTPAIEGIQDKLKEIERTFTDEDYSKEIYRLIVEAENGIKEAQEAVNAAEGDFITVQGIVRLQHEQLQKFDSKLYRIISDKEDADTKKAELAKEEHQHTEVQTETQESIKCSYCGSNNQKAVDKCTSCGAAL